jgi:hypothetical protein
MSDDEAGAVVSSFLQAMAAFLVLAGYRRSDPNATVLRHYVSRANTPPGRVNRVAAAAMTSSLLLLGAAFSFNVKFLAYRGVVWLSTAAAARTKV